VRTDEELAESVRTGDEAAYASLYERYRRSLYLFAVRMLGGSEPALDLVQETFLTLWECRGEMDRVRSVRGWLFTLARNRCVSLLRKRQAHARLEMFAESAIEAMEPAGRGLESAEELRLVRLALSELPLEQREALVLREYEELSYREIAAITEASESAVKARLFRARQALAERLRPALAEGDER
jgi:RNA polymerase sigma-70 factor (ECF subfamily)